MKLYELLFIYQKGYKAEVA